MPCTGTRILTMQPPPKRAVGASAAQARTPKKADTGSVFDYQLLEALSRCIPVAFDAPTDLDQKIAQTVASAPVARFLDVVATVARQDTAKLSLAEAAAVAKLLDVPTILRAFVATFKDSATVTG